MRSLWLPVSVLATCTFSTVGLAQQRLVQDTLGGSTPGSVNCGFCAGERFGVVFRELPSPLRGLVPGDFPVVLESVEIAVAAANPATGCAASQTGGTATIPMEIYVGSVLPSEDDGIVRLYDPSGPWPGETLLWAADARLALSTADAAGAYSVNFNLLRIRDEMGATIRVESGAYLRVVLTIPADPSGTSSSCAALGFDPPAIGFPFLDRDQSDTTDRRSFIYAAGIGWIWNSEGWSPVPAFPSDWSVRLTLFTFGPGPSDGGAAMLDAGSPLVDASASMDASTTDAGSGTPAGGCSCGVPSSPRRQRWMLLVALVVLGASRAQGRARLKRTLPGGRASTR